jgi:hypothetical protein
MAKNPPRSVEGSGFPIAAESLDLELYLLACGFAASSTLSDQGSPSVQHLRKTFESSEISRRLITIAVIVRSHLDQCSDSAMKRLNAKIGSVGELTPDAGKPTKTQNLDLREACNKIIHALDVHFEFSETGSENLGGLLPQVTLIGDRYGKPWTAILDIYAFIDGAQRLT